MLTRILHALISRQGRLTLILLAVIALGFIAAQSPAPTPQDLLAAVNALRAEKGLPPYQANPILMAVAQSHAAYMASTGLVTHYSANGSRPFQRGLAAGYPLAGDLSQGGFYSENIIAGYQMSPQQAVLLWQGDAPHLNTMLSDHLTEAGAGVAFSGDTIYYVLDAARPVAGGAPVWTPPPSVTVLPPVAPVSVTSTPWPDGHLTHTVQAGQTLWTIAAVYGLPLDTLLALNNLTANSPIYPGQELLIRPAAETPPTAAAAAPTRAPVGTAMSLAETPTAHPVTPTPTASPAPPTPTAEASPSNTPPRGIAASIPWAILALALILAFVTSRTG